MAAKKLVLPKAWYLDTVERLVREALPELLGQLAAGTAWRYVYALVIWTELKEGVRYLHLNDRLSSEAGKQLAARGERYLLANLAKSPVMEIEPLIDHVGKAYEALRRDQGITGPWQRNNVTGAALETAVQALINEICGVLPTRSPDLRKLRGFELAPRGYHSRPDLILFSAQDFRVLLSTKWTLRKERLGTFLHEAYFYRQRRSDLQVAFVVNEFNLSVLEWLLEDPLVDRVYHVHKPMLMKIHEPFAAGTSVSAQALLADGRTPKPAPPKGESRTQEPRATMNVDARQRQEVKDYQRWLNVRERLFDLSDLFADVEILKAAGAKGATRDEAVPEDEASIAAEKAAES